VRRVALATDLKEHSPELFAHCLALALHAKADLYLVHIMDSDGPDTSWKSLPTVRSLLEKWKVLGADATPEDFASVGIRVHPLDFSPADPQADRVAWGPSADVTGLAVTRHVAEIGPDLLVLGTHARQGFDRLLQPSVAEPVARDAQRVTLFVPDGSRGFVDLETGKVTIRRVMVPVSSDVNPQPLIDELVRMLTAFDVGASFTFVHVGSDATLPTPSLPTRTDWAWKTDRRTGSVVEQILEAEVEHQPDLVAMATAGAHGILDALRGTTTERVLRRIRTPLFTVSVR
jgi:nucleotide-binding universal stress UspA family protein